MTDIMTVRPDRLIRDQRGRDWALLKPDRIESILISSDGRVMKIYLKPQGALSFRISRSSGNERERYFLIDKDIEP